MMFACKEHKLIYRFDSELVQIEAWGANALRVRATQNMSFSQYDWALEGTQAGEGEVTVTEKSGSIRNGKITAHINEHGVIHFTNEKGEVLLKEFARRLQDESSMALAIPSREYKLPQGDLYETHVYFYPNKKEKIFGMGQYQQHELNLKGCVLELAQRNSQASVPFYVSSLGYGFLWNNPAVGSVAFANNGTEWIAKATSQIDYLIIAGDEPAEIVENYMQLTGLPPMMPEYGLGFWQCKLRYATQEELLTVAREYHKRGIPVDVIVCDFFHWPHQGDYRFDPEFWPDPVAMCKELKEMGMRLMVSVWPTVQTDSENYQEMLANGYLTRVESGIRHTMFDTVSFFDATNPECRDYVWQKIKKNYWDLGAQLYWLDVAEPEYSNYAFENYRYQMGKELEVGNVYPKLYLKGFYDGMKANGDENPISLIRCAWAGSAKYGALLWSGDIISNFECFHRQVMAGMNVAIAGIPWWTTDIGGFHGGNGDDPAFRELFARWFAFGCFCPVMRLHGNRNPWHQVEKARCGSGADNEIWSYGDEIYELCKKYIGIREKMRDYNRAQMKQAHEKGTPVMRPLMYDFPADPEAWETEDAYMFGNDLLVAPVMEEGMKERSVYLPAGNCWVNVWTGETFEGGQHVTVQTPVDVIPVFAKQGAAVLDCFK